MAIVNKSEGIDKLTVSAELSNGQKIKIEGKYIFITNSMDFTFTEETEGETREGIDIPDKHCFELEKLFTSLAEIFERAPKEDINYFNFDMRGIMRKRGRE
jgi:hypothetical protein